MRKDHIGDINRMMGLALAATLGLCAPAGAKDVLTDALGGAAITNLFYGECSTLSQMPTVLSQAMTQK